MPKKKILFQLNYLYHLPAVEPIIKLFAEDDKYDVAYQISLDFQYKLGILRKKIDQMDYKTYFPENARVIEKDEKFDVVIGTDVIDSSKFKNKYSCIVYHGPTFNKTVTYRELQRYSTEKYIIFAESEFTKNKLIESKSIGSSEIEVVGFPKMDPYLNNNYDKNKMLNELGMDPNKKTVLYAPTYKPTSIYDLSTEIFEATKQYNLIIKLHHYSWMGKYANRSQSRIMFNQLKNYEHAVLLPQMHYNIVPLYAAADTLISEASGALTEFMMTEKVGIVYKLDDKLLSRSNSEPLLSENNDLIKEVFVEISKPAELYGAVQKAVSPDIGQIKSIKKYKDRYFYKNDGKASLRTKAYIDNMLL